MASLSSMKMVIAILLIQMFSVHAWDSMGKKYTALVRVEYQDQAEHHHGQQQDVDAIKSPLTGLSSALPLLVFPNPSGGLRRSKREWVFPPIKIMENDRGPFPKQIAQIKSSHAKETQIVYRITGEGADQPPVELFSIDRSTGKLFVSKPLDRETKDKYELQAHAHSTTDNTQESTIEIVIEVLDQNENTPVFTQNPFLGNVPVASKIGFEFMTVTATDADDPNTDNADIRYSIISQVPPEPNPNMFVINPFTGAILVNADGLDREKYPEYTLEIQAADMQGQGRHVTGKAIITVTDLDKSLIRQVAVETKTEWVIPPVQIFENDRGPFPKEIAQIKASHAKGTQIVYRITGEGADQPPVELFTIDRNTGRLFVSKPLDREVKDKYELQVHAHLPTDNIQESATKFIVEVLDQNDNTPVFTQNPFIGNVPIASKIGFEFITITATDADDPNTDNADIRYSIISQIPPEPSANFFAINPVTGAIRVKADGLDREKYPEYTLEIQAADMQGQGRHVTGKAIITVTDLDKSLIRQVAVETKAEWVIPPIRISENERGPFHKEIAQIKSSRVKETQIVYSITGVGADQPSVELFTIDRNTGRLFVSKPLDREAKDKYELQAHAYSPTDNIHEPAIEVIVEVLDQNDNTPVFTQNPFHGTVPQASKIGFEFMTVTATDADDPNTDNADIRYSIISQIPPEPSANIFAINSVTGAIRVNADGLDREKYPEYTVEIQAADMQGQGRHVTGKAIITVTDKPLNTAEWVIPPIVISENDRGPFPKNIMQIKSSHAKQTKIVYSITGEGADQPPVGLFTVDKDSGWLSVTKSLDGEIKHEYLIQAHATGDGVNEQPIEITIQVIDQNKPGFT